MLNVVGSKAKTLAALYNASKTQGFLAFVETPEMSEKQAQTILDFGQTYFDYLQGRVMKIDLEHNDFDPFLYDRDNGEGAAAKALESVSC